MKNSTAPAVVQQHLVRHLLDEIAIVEKQRDGLKSFLQVNSQYWKDRQPTMDFYNAQIKRLNSYLPNSVISKPPGDIQTPDFLKP